MALWRLTQLLQKVIHKAEEASDRVLGLSGIDLCFLSSLGSLYGGKGSIIQTVLKACFHLLELFPSPVSQPT